jgi:Cys-tRNA(Pro) deacylase
VRAGDLSQPFSLICFTKAQTAIEGKDYVARAPHSDKSRISFESGDRVPMIVLMHGDRNVDTKALAGQLAVSKIWSCAPAVAERFSGWQVGATNPFALKTPMPLHLEESVLELPRMYVNGGGRGLLVSMRPADFYRILEPRLVRCAKEKPVLGSKAP